MKQYIIYGILGTLMGFILSNIGFANFDEVHKMFTFADFRLLFTFAGAVSLVAVLMMLTFGRIPRQKKIMQPGLLPGSMLFGFGWALTGACPAIVFVQLGQGHIPALMTLFGIYLGVLFYKKAHARYFMWEVGACNSA